MEMKTQEAAALKYQYHSWFLLESLTCARQVSAEFRKYSTVPSAFQTQQ